MTTASFIRQVLPKARDASLALGIPVSPILAQWINETGSGTSRAFKEWHNPAGISIMEPQMKQFGAVVKNPRNKLLGFPTLDKGVKAYVRRWEDPVYGPTRQRWQQNRNAIAVAEAIQESPWAAGHYDHRGLVDLIHSEGLERYDSDTNPSGDPTGSGTGGSPSPHVAPCAALTPGPPPKGHPLLRIGARGDKVKDLQYRLRDAGFAPRNSFDQHGKADGVFGPHTAEAVVQFQYHHGLHPDGIVGRQTYCALGIR